MTPVEFAILFAVLGFILIVADLFVPSGGVLSVAGAIAMVAAIVCCFLVSTRLGAAAAVIMLVISPFAIMTFLRVWPHTFIGKRMTLSTVATTATAPQPLADSPPQPGERGTAITELRPVGMCDFAGNRLEAVSDRGLIDVGSPVIVVGTQDHRPVVRPVQNPTSERFV